MECVVGVGIIIINMKCTINLLTVLNYIFDEQMSLSLYDKAYKYYRKKWDNAALKVLEKMNGEEARVMELKAQIYYRLNQFEKSLQLFMYKLMTY